VLLLSGFDRTRSLKTTVGATAVVGFHWFANRSTFFDGSDGSGFMISFNSKLLSRCVRLDVFLSGGKLPLGFPTYHRRHPQVCRRSSRSDKGCTVVLIQMFLDGGYDSGYNFQSSSPRW